MRRYEVIEYTHEDMIGLIDQISIEEVIERLDNLEGTWMSKMPNVYYSVYYNKDAVCDEHDYELIRTLFAVRKAVMLLKKIKKEDGEQYEGSKI